ncbi:LIM domain transcription factor LMO4-B like protein [Argiope bruennichi]|uniref:LIM domain transcription factor LMO4-B like protein n=1 Tax=Argiope bruennichi TaxID=94029 RepID=A0A8T0G2J3_ARGBR|nr:LIM domain transcription factor LMO4-B like protein [Argiope bruennichi]
MKILTCFQCQSSGRYMPSSPDGAPSPTCKASVHDLNIVLESFHIKLRSFSFCPLPTQGFILVPIRKKRNSNLSTTESPYGNYPTDCCPSNHMSMMNPPGHHGDQHHMMGMMATHHGGMATMQQIQPPQQQQQQQQQHFSPPGGPGGSRCCAGCGAKIMDRFLLHALDRYWHNGCLKCSCCQATLADIGSSCFTKGGMILCKNDYVSCLLNLLRDSKTFLLKSEISEVNFSVPLLAGTLGIIACYSDSAGNTPLPPLRICQQQHPSHFS